MPMRIDKYLKVSRLLKRRETAKELCLDGDIKINDRPAKPMSEVKVGDKVELQLGRHQIVITVLQIREFAKKEDAALMYRVESDITKENSQND